MVEYLGSEILDEERMQSSFKLDNPTEADVEAILNMIYGEEKENNTMERANTIVEMIKAQGYEASAHEVRKGDEVNIGITVGSGMMRPTIYPKWELSDKEIVDDILNVYENTKVNNDFDITQFTDYAKAKENLQICLRRPTSDECTDIKRMYLDMEMYIRVIIPSMTSDDGMGSVVVKPEHIQNWGVTEDTLFEDAKANIEPNLTVRTMKDVILEMMGEDALEMADMMPDDGMYYMSNTSKMHGANAFLLVDKIKEIAEKEQNDLLIIPSSIHEILIQAYNGMPLKEADEMVQEVNETQVMPNEQLSDHAYYFSRETGKITY